jgi:hypothetical protein
VEHEIKISRFSNFSSERTPCDWKLVLNSSLGETMKYSLLLIIPTVVGCSQSLAARDPNSQGLAKAKPTVTITASFKSLAELPRCDAGSEQMSAYISERDVFVQCRKFFWRDVKPGDTSTKYLAREPIRYNEWIDANTKMRWSLPKQDEVSIASAKTNVCSQGWKLPTRDELLIASINGLFEGLKSRGGVAFDKAWTANLDAIAGISKGSLQDVLPKEDSNVKAAVYCVASVN